MRGGVMEPIVVQVRAKAKAKILVELLNSLDFVEIGDYIPTKKWTQTR